MFGRRMSTVSSKVRNKCRNQSLLKRTGQSSYKTLYLLMKSKHLNNVEGLLKLLYSEQETSWWNSGVKNAI
jgi:hypothetical protein